MSIQKHNGGAYLVPTCDICGDELEAETDFYDAVNAKKAAGWISRRDGDEWSDICTSWQAEYSELAR